MLKSTALHTRDDSDLQKERLLPSPQDSESEAVVPKSHVSPRLTSQLEIDTATPILERKLSNEGEQSPRVHDTHPKDEELTDQDRLNFYGRWIEIARFIGSFPAALLAIAYQSGATDFDNQMDGVADKIGGFIIVSGLHLFFKNKYQKIKSLNPLYRNFKTLATAGVEVGIVVASSISSLPMLLATAIFSLGIGLISIPYWLLRDRFLKGRPMHERNRYFKTGIEGWSKYAKTFLVFGLYVGEIFGTVMAYAMRGDFLKNIAFFGAVGSVVTFVAGLLIVPIVNRFFGDQFITTKDGFRNNYVRSGITLGIALGTVIGFIAMPGSVVIAMTVGAAIGGVAGGAALGAMGSRITKYIQDNWNVKMDTDNSWDYATRNSSYLFGFIGMAIGFFIPVPGGAMTGAAIGTSIGGAAVGMGIAGATLGGAIFSIIGWGLGLVVIRQARKTCKEEHKADTLPWTQRIAYGSMYGSMLGATLGFFMGLIGGPALATMGGTLGFSGGAILGGFVFGLWDGKSRELIKMFFRGESVAALAAEKDKQVVPEKVLMNGNGVTHDVVETPAPAAAPAAQLSVVLPITVRLEAAPATSSALVIASLHATTQTPAVTPPSSLISPSRSTNGLATIYMSPGRRRFSSAASSDVLPVTLLELRKADEKDTDQAKENGRENGRLPSFSMWNDAEPSLEIKEMFEASKKPRFASVR